MIERSIKLFKNIDTSQKQFDSFQITLMLIFPNLSIHQFKKLKNIFRLRIGPICYEEIVCIIYEKIIGYICTFK